MMTRETDMSETLLPEWNDLPQTVRTAICDEGVRWFPHIGADAAHGIYVKLRELLALESLSSPSGEMEPVAWRYRSQYDSWEYASTELWNASYMVDFRGNHPEAEPLYSASQLASLRQELSEARQISPGAHAYGWKIRAERAESAFAALKEAQTTAATDVLAERRRQIEAEGWTAEHDDEHTGGQLAIAAACYAANRANFMAGRVFFQTGWPWNWEWWKPTNRRRDLVKAGALILAEIERIDRAALAAEKERQP